MARTRSQLFVAVAATEAWCNSLDMAAISWPRGDPADLFSIGEALKALASWDLELADRVAAARANGRTWTQIAAVLGVSKQAARERFGADEPARANPPR